mgnify:CR=1 FL=1
MKTHIHYSALRLLLFPSSPYLLFRLISLVATDVYPTVILRRYTRPFHNIWQWWHCRSSRPRRAARGKIILSDDIANITYFLRIHIHYAVEQYRNVTTKCMKVFCYLINAYPLSLKMRISCMEPKLAKVFCSSSSERPFAMPPQYTVQLVGLDWLYTSSKVKGLELAVKDQEKMHN